MLHLYEAQYIGAVWITGVTHLYEALTPAYTRPTATRPLPAAGCISARRCSRVRGGVNTVNALACATDIMPRFVCLNLFGF